VQGQIAGARADQKSMSVVGERGTGRTTVLTQLMRDVEPVVFDAAEVVYESESAWLQRLTLALDGAEDPVVIEDVHLLSPSAARIAHLAVERTSAWVALSSNPLHLLTTDVFALVDSSDVRLELLPLRLHKHEIPAMVEAMLAELSSTVRFTPGAVRALLDHNWPGNVAELRNEVAAAARRRSAGDVAEGDLVRLKDRASAPELSVIDTALRATLEEALARHGGNKLAAARSLNISRTTLYKRMHTFGLTNP
jgi:hypothetical protein